MESSDGKVGQSTFLLEKSAEVPEYSEESQHPRVKGQEPEVFSMVIKCAWCGKIMKKGTGEADEPISHGICEECAVLLREEASEK